MLSVLYSFPLLRNECIYVYYHVSTYIEKWVHMHALSYKYIHSNVFECMQASSSDVNEGILSVIFSFSSLRNEYMYIYYHMGTYTQIHGSVCRLHPLMSTNGYWVYPIHCHYSEMSICTCIIILVHTFKFIGIHTGFILWCQRRYTECDIFVFITQKCLPSDDFSTIEYTQSSPCGNVYMFTLIIYIHYPLMTYACMHL